MRYHTLAARGGCCLFALAVAVAVAMVARADEPADKAAAEKQTAEKKAAAEKKAVEDELKALQGTWKIVSISIHGQELAEDSFKSWRRIVDGTHITWKNDDGTFMETSIKVDPTKTPKQIDSTALTGDIKDKTMLAIYELKGDEFRMCFADPDMPRPTEFASRPGMNGVSMYTAKRVKEKDKP
jgi:uncharacterized protein (TIGR03067 family)